MTINSSNQSWRDFFEEHRPDMECFVIEEQFADVADASYVETALIDEYGLLKDRTGTLYNDRRGSFLDGPRSPPGQRVSSPGAHIAAWKAQPKFVLEATLRPINTINPWRPNTSGHRFYTKVLSQNPATVGDAMALGTKAGFSAHKIQEHLRWLYTWGGSYIEIAGQVYAKPEPGMPE
jgi:hypothetical protein